MRGVFRAAIRGMIEISIADLIKKLLCRCVKRRASARRIPTASRFVQGQKRKLSTNRVSGFNYR